MRAKEKEKKKGISRAKAAKRRAASAVMAMAGRAARACDVCARDRARWYCAADEAYLCGRCDNSVHCVNALASRHERVRLGPNGIPSKPSDRGPGSGKKTPHSLQVKKKATKGGSKHCSSKGRMMIKDEMLAQSFFSNPDDIRVPGYMVDSPPLSEDDQGLISPHGLPGHVPELQLHQLQQLGSPVDDENPQGRIEVSPGYGNLDVIPKELDALERGSDEDEYLDFTDTFTEADFLDQNGDDGSSPLSQSFVKTEYSPESTVSSDGQFQPSFVVSDTGAGVVEATVSDSIAVKVENISLLYPSQGCTEEGKRCLPPLKLNYEDVLNAWSDRGPFWVEDDGQPQTVPVFSNMEIALNLDLENFHREQVGEVPVLGISEEGLEASGDGREARVMRYREKRRTRLFSKQIRYEVRKLNAERRPRMKGRFVKRLPS
ncbi:hypothetical protein R1sor_007465 [Riccia sorocarpa]|uniref:Uncharacterized protein n=1 Tax=Riccia sorocarpa TaxID=122646 RepID=A0ABD3HWV1_9MARC